MRKLRVPLFSFVVSAALLLLSCGPGSTTTTPQTTTTTPPVPSTTTAAPPPTTQPASDKPKYGGIITVRDPVDALCCDSAANRQMTNSLVLWYSHEQLLRFDWTRGPAGTGEFTTLVQKTPESSMGGELVESVEKPSPQEWILNIRQNVHYQQTGTEAGRLVNGREMTTDDVIEAYERLIHGPNGAIQVLQPRVAAGMTLEKTGPWQVKFTTTVQPVTAHWWVIEGGGYAFMYPPELVEKYGNLNDWKTIVGTGPWIVRDWVPGSSVTYTRNDNYWGVNPIGPGKGDQLPYADGVKRVVIPDISTTFAAMRTGKIDMLGALTFDQFEELNSTAPDLESLEYLGDGFANAHAFNLNFADKSKPWADKRVRQALMMAIDYDGIVNGYFQGKAEKDTILVNKNFVGAGYKPVTEMSQTIQDLYKYNPDKAKQLLTEAGFPNGFKAEVLVPSVPQERVDEATIVKEMWSRVGVDLTIAPIESAALTARVTRTFDWTDMFYGTFQGGTASAGAFPLYTYFAYYRGDNRLQFASRTDPNGTPDPTIEAAFARTQENLYINWPEVYKAVEDVRPYIIENAFRIPFPQPVTYNMWWPWMKNTFGLGPAVPFFFKLYWVDKDLKSSMGY